MAGSLAHLVFGVLALFSSCASGALKEYSFHVGNMAVTKLCQQHVVPAANGGIPGPAIIVQEGDSLIINAINDSPYNLTLHWHGIFQVLSPWADGPNYVTQCPIRPGQSYAYRFTIVGQEGTLWWHAHVDGLRATVHGVLIIRPRPGRSYPFPLPFSEFPIVLAEWWNANPVDIQNQAIQTGAAPNISDAFTINGFPGDLYPCSNDQMHRISVIQGKTYLLRIINAALNTQLFFMVAKHQFTVVAVDASYTNPYVTQVIVIAPGQTVDALITADQSPSSYYMAATAYASNPAIAFDNTTTRGLFVYENSPVTSVPVMPNFPAFGDTPTANRFYTSLTGLVSGPYWTPPPRVVDHNMFVTIGVGSIRCQQNQNCTGPLNTRLAASMNNASFQTPTRTSILQAFVSHVDGVYTDDFPATPPVEFDYTNPNLSNDTSLTMTTKSTKVFPLKYNATVEIVFQNTAIIAVENHPMHLHGFNFHVMAQGFGNYQPNRDSANFNLYNPPNRNTIAVPTGGWAVIRFQANNPGVWFMHCHLDVHLSIGLATAFVVENGGTEKTTVPPPPADLPIC